MTTATKTIISEHHHKTDDVWFMYLTVKGTTIKDEQYMFNTKKFMQAFIDRIDHLSIQRDGLKTLCRILGGEIL